MITAKQDDLNIRRIHGYLQMRAAFRKVYGTTFQHEKERYQHVLSVSPEERAAMARTYRREIWKQLALLFGAGLVLRFFVCFLNSTFCQP